MKGWKFPLMFTVAAACLLFDEIISHHYSIPFNIAFAITSAGTLAGWTNYLYKRGRESARSLSGKLLPNGEDQGE